MSGIAVAIGGSALVGGVLASQAQKDAANKAAGASQYGTDQSVALQRYMYDTSRNDMLPYMNIGVQSLYDTFGYTPATQVQSTLSDYQKRTGNYTMPGMTGIQTYNALQNNGIGQMIPSGSPFYAIQNTGTTTPEQSQVGGNIGNLFSNRRLGGRLLTSSPAVEPQQQFINGFTTPVAQSGGVIKTSQGIDPTGGSSKYLDMLESLKFELDPTDEIYKWREEQTNKAINQAAAARGMYNSRPTINALGDANMALQEAEINRQYKMNYQDPYAQFVDLYNMATQQGQLNYGKALDAIKAGQGAAGTMGQLGANTAGNISSAYMQNAGNQANIALQQGQTQSDLWSGLGAMPMNYMMLQNLFGGNSWQGLGSQGTMYNPSTVNLLGY